MSSGYTETITDLKKQQQQNNLFAVANRNRRLYMNPYTKIVPSNLYLIHAEPYTYSIRFIHCKINVTYLHGNTQKILHNFFKHTLA